MVFVYFKYFKFWKDSCSVRILFGVFMLILIWVVVVVFCISLYDVDLFYGVLFIFYVLGIVWVVDIGVFFVGVKFGCYKLCFNVLLGKSLEGLLGGIVVLFVIIVFVVFYYQVEFLCIWFYFVIGGIMVVVFVFGDLNESMFKCCVGIKDSGKIFFGYGGVFDRIDSLIVVFFVFVFCYVIWMV